MFNGSGVLVAPRVYSVSEAVIGSQVQLGWSPETTRQAPSESPEHLF